MSISVESLSKQQLILVMLLVSFVTSLATGIVVVSLMDQQSAQPVTRAVNQVVERTIERVVPPQTIREQVIVKEEDAIANSIEKSRRASARILVYPEGSSRATLTGNGIVLSENGMVILFADKLGDAYSYKVELADGRLLPLILKRYDQELRGNLFKIDLPQSALQKLSYIKLANSEQLKQGQRIIGVNPERTGAVSLGIISRYELSGNSEAPLKIQKIFTDLDNTTQSLQFITTLDGDLMGIKSPDNGHYIPSSYIKVLLEK
jgi:S1-C subfamily serine protease